ncbi:PLC-like phosphodiesterase [Aspergillus pseudoustus]|uniref:PLC-like phosphodiesterase n=1 Tax=Aspergillus pseudoustus TaxID=1810923 RepID=A0ABR4J3K0_9EURO
MASWNEKPINCIVWINQPEVDVIFHTPGDTRRFHMADKWNDWRYGINLFTGDSTTPAITSKDPWASTEMKVRGGWAEKFSFSVVRNGKTLVTRWQDINAFTGNLGDGDMGRSLDEQKITIVDGLIIHYTFYDAGQYPTPELPDAHQCYVTVAPDRSAWMTSLVPPGSPTAQKPFTRFALPGGHNFGLNSMASCRALTANLTPAAIVAKILGPWLGPLGFVGNLGVIGAAKALGIMEATSRNQKDSVSDQLAMGARYFEVRASRVDPKLRALSGGMPDELYFHHAILPGITIRSFFEDTVEFLCKQRDEIVVVWFTWNNWSSDHPEPETVLAMLQTCFDTAAAKGVTLARGTFADMALPVETLRQQNKRFIMSFKNEGSTTNPDPATQPYDEYDSHRHAVADGSGIVAEFESMSGDKQKGAAMTYLQCQTTLTNSGIPLTAAVMFHNSILLAQKANTDRATLGWLYANAKAKFGDDHVLVILNDFFDLGTSDVADQITKMRLWDP